MIDTWPQHVSPRQYLVPCHLRQESRQAERRGSGRLSGGGLWGARPSLLGSRRLRLVLLPLGWRRLLCRHSLGCERRLQLEEVSTCDDSGTVCVPGPHRVEAVHTLEHRPACLRLRSSWGGLAAASAPAPANSTPQSVSPQPWRRPPLHATHTPAVLPHDEGQAAVLAVAGGAGGHGGDAPQVLRRLLAVLAPLAGVSHQQLRRHPALGAQPGGDGGAGVRHGLACGSQVHHLRRHRAAVRRRAKWVHGSGPHGSQRRCDALAGARAARRVRHFAQDLRSARMMMRPVRVYVAITQPFPCCACLSQS